MRHSPRVWPIFSCLAATAVGIATVVLYVAVLEFWLFARLPASTARKVDYVDIEPGAGALKVSQLLMKRGIITDARKFYFLCRILNASHRLKAGEYAFLSPASPVSILDQLIQGKVVLHRITVPEGATLWDVARIIEEQGLASREEIIRLATDRNYAGKLGLDATGLEGFLFPETYHFEKRQGGAFILKTMVQQFWRHYPEEWQRRTKDLGLTVRQVVVMASLVEKEAVVDLERPRIAAVFFNRLKRDMPLQSDPTAVYDIPDFSGPVTTVHLKRMSPYNTYMVKGLPPGPICSPGVKSIEAVLYPEKVPYLYFVSNNDGTHQFSETLSEHHEAVARYREKRRAAQGNEAPALLADPSHSGVGILEMKVLK